jgi:thiol:disulfide interchange protein DsbA
MNRRIDAASSLARSALGTFLVFAFSSAFAQAQQSVRAINPPQPTDPTKVEVIEFFAYGCPLCADLETPFEAWAKKQPTDVKISRIPTNSPIAGVDSTVLFYTLEALGDLERLHAKIFNAIHVERVILGHEGTRNKWLASQGVDPAKFAAAQKSFSVVTKITRAQQLSESYRIASIPTLVIGGRISTSPGGRESREFMSRVDKLVAEERGRSKAK